MLPSILEPRRHVVQALHAVVIEAYFAGVQPAGISKSQVSCICAVIDLQVQAFLSRPAGREIMQSAPEPSLWPWT
ncbi:transposase [Synechococcus sp. HK01-R]|uniref:transposase n=1 Tax=Synechococcus sp. HK01-R TaxID=2751171 RepID=UPI0016294CD4|nr:transposase [Synechococcus sp. HK01-R]